MSATGSERPGASRDETALHAYHDGELTRWGRWRFERRLARSPELRRELEALARVRELVRASEAREPTPDLWGGIERRLPSADARRAEAESARGGLGAWLGSPLRSLGAAAAAAAAAALAFVLLSSDNPTAGVVRWMDSGGRNVMVLEGDEEVTIIWVIGLEAGPSSGGGARGLA
jgi:anti-sigma-K factor RskA